MEHQRCRQKAVIEGEYRYRGGWIPCAVWFYLGVSLFARSSASCQVRPIKGHFLCSRPCLLIKYVKSIRIGSLQDSVMVNVVCYCFLFDCQERFERSVRYHSLDGGMLHFPGYISSTRGKVVQSSSQPCHISSAVDGLRTVADESCMSVKSLAHEFPSYLRLPKVGETVKKSLGFVWLKQLAYITKKDPETSYQELKPTPKQRTKRLRADTHGQGDQDTNLEVKRQRSYYTSIRHLVRQYGFGDYTWATTEKYQVTTQTDLDELMLQIAKLRLSMDMWPTQIVMEKAQQDMQVMTEKLIKGETHLDMASTEWRRINIATAEFNLAKIENDILDHFEAQVMSKYNENMSKIQKMREFIFQKQSVIDISDAALQPGELCHNAYIAADHTDLGGSTYV